MKKIIHILFIAVFNTLWAAAGEPVIYIGEVSSFGNYDMAGKTFYVQSGDASVGNTDLEFLKYKDILVQALVRKLAVPVDDQSSADVCVFLDYGQFEKSYVSTASTPVHGITSLSLSTIESTTIAHSTTHVSGGQVISQQVSKYNFVLNVHAYDNQDKHAPEAAMLWKITVNSLVRDNDMQYMFPYLAEMAIPFIGRNSHGIRRAEVRSDDMDVYMMRYGYYIAENATVFYPYIVESNNMPIWLHSLYWKNNVTYVNLAFTPIQEKLTCPKFKYNTCLVYKGVEYPLLAVFIPQAVGNYINRRVYPLPYVEESYVQLAFSVSLQKGDTIDIISYRNNRKTKEYITYKNVILE